MKNIIKILALICIATLFCSCRSDFESTRDINKSISYYSAYIDEEMKLIAEKNTEKLLETLEIDEIHAKYISIIMVIVHINTIEEVVIESTEDNYSIIKIVDDAEYTFFIKVESGGRLMSIQIDDFDKRHLYNDVIKENQKYLLKKLKLDYDHSWGIAQYWNFVDQERIKKISIQEQDEELCIIKIRNAVGEKYYVTLISEMLIMVQKNDKDGEVIYWTH